MEEIKHNCGAWIAARVSRRREDPGCATSAASVRRAMLRCWVLCWGAGTMWPTFLAREKIQITPAGVGSAFPLRGKQTMEGNPEAKQNHQV